MARNKKSNSVLGKVKLVLYLVVAIALVACGFALSQFLNRSSDDESNVTLTTTSVSEVLEECTDLTTMRMEYRGLVTYEEGEIDFLTKTGFTMIYDAEIRAGVDLSVAEISVDGTDVSIVLPRAEVQSISIDSDTLEFYDEKYALFNWQDQEDVATALSMAEEDAEAYVEASTMLSDAEDQAVTAIEALFSPFTSDGTYTVSVSFSDDIVSSNTYDSSDGSSEEE